MREKISISKLIPLGFQHVFAMFGATIFVPLATGLDPSVALFTSGIGTLLFHVLTKGKVPAYLGSSFAFIAPITLAASKYGVSAAMGACAVVGLLYVLASFIIKQLGVEVIDKLIPPVVIGPIIIVIGLGLASVANDYSSQHYLTAFFTLAVVIVTSIYSKGFFKVIPVLTGILAGYLFSLILQTTGLGPALVDFTVVQQASWMPSLPNFTAPTFNLNAILLVVPVGLVTMIEHMGDMMAISRTVEIDYFKDPGVHKTLLGDGLATALAGLLGGPPNTTYGENIGILALTKVYNPIVVEAAAVIVLILSVLPKIGAILQTIPLAVMGGVMIMVFGMIASVGLRTLIEKNVDLKETRNLIIVSVILVIGLSGITLFGMAGMSLSAIVGIALNKLLP